MQDTNQTAAAIAAYLRLHGDPITKGNVEDVLAELVAPLGDAQDFAYGDLGQAVDDRPTLDAAVAVGQRMYHAQGDYDLRTWSRTRNRVYCHTLTLRAAG